MIRAGSVAAANADGACFFAGNEGINDITRTLFKSMSVGHADDVLGESISKFERLVVQEFERIDGACFDDVLGVCLHLAAIAVHAERNAALALNLHGVINVKRLAIEKHLVTKDLRERL